MPCTAEPPRRGVTLGQPRTNDDGPVWDVVDAVGMREAIEKLPQRLDTLLAKELWGGAELSGGQWQRLACGRVLLQGRAADSVAGEAVAERLPTAGARMIATAVKARTTIMATRSP